MPVNLEDISEGSRVFLDANIFVYAFAPDPQFGHDCLQLLQRIERQELTGCTSSHVLSNVAHRLMTLEACVIFGWPYAGSAARIQKHPAEIQQLTRFRQAISQISAIGVQTFSVSKEQVETAARLSQQFGLLSNDSLILAVMQDNGLTQLASHDSDFDRASGISRFSLA